MKSDLIIALSSIFFISVITFILARAQRMKYRITDIIIGLLLIFLFM